MKFFLMVLLVAFATVAYSNPLARRNQTTRILGDRESSLLSADDLMEKAFMDRIQNEIRESFNKYFKNKIFDDDFRLRFDQRLHPIGKPDNFDDDQVDTKYDVKEVDGHIIQTNETTYKGGDKHNFHIVRSKTVLINPKSDTNELPARKAIVDHTEQSHEDRKEPLEPYVPKVSGDISF